jgi:DNA-nicking Smr family endonuclease
MKLNIYDQVLLKSTGERAMISEIFPGGMILIVPEGKDIQVPVFSGDILPIILNEDGQENLKTEELTLAFDPKILDGEECYRMIILNRTSKSFYLEITFNPLDGEKQIWSENLSPKDVVSWIHLYKDEIGDYPKLEVKATRIEMESSIAPIEKIISIKPQIFFGKAPIYLDALGRSVPTLKILDSNEFHSKGELAAHALENRSKSFGKTKSAEQKFNPKGFGSSKAVPKIDLFAIASFSNEIDLHIEKLISQDYKLEPSEMLHTQMYHLEKFLEKSWQYGINPIFIIHGFGKGVLKESIHKRLKNHPHVKEFNNHYHPKFGNGATEVKFI